jgi:hypothetical protein
MRTDVVRAQRKNQDRILSSEQDVIRDLQVPPADVQAVGELVRGPFGGHAQARPQPAAATTPATDGEVR